MTTELNFSPAHLRRQREFLTEHERAFRAGYRKQATRSPAYVARLNRAEDELALAAERGMVDDDGYVF